MKFFSIAVLSLSVFLSGCNTTLFSNCKQLAQKNKSFELSGLNVPLSELINEPIKIGKLTYNTTEAKEISEVIRALDSQQFAFCKLSESRNFDKISQNAKDNVFNSASLSYSMISALTMKMVKAENVDDVMEEIEKVKKNLDAGESVLEKAQKELGEPVGGVLKSEVKDIVNESNKVIFDRIAILEDKFYYSADFNKIQVTGYESNGINLLADARIKIIDDFKRKINILPKDKIPHVIFLSYVANPDGHEYEKAFQRAKSLEELLRGHSFDRDFYSEISLKKNPSLTKGVLNRVDVLVI